MVMQLKWKRTKQNETTKDKEQKTKQKQPYKNIGQIKVLEGQPTEQYKN